MTSLIHQADPVHVAFGFPRQRIDRLRKRDGNRKRRFPQRLELIQMSDEQIHHEPPLDSAGVGRLDLFDEGRVIRRVRERIRHECATGESNANRPVGLLAGAVQESVDADPFEFDCESWRTDTVDRSDGMSSATEILSSAGSPVTCSGTSGSGGGTVNTGRSR